MAAVVAGMMGHEEPMGHVTPDKGTLYHLSNDPSTPYAAEVAYRPVNISNGLTWSHDNKVMYYMDTPTKRIDAFEL